VRWSSPIALALLGLALGWASPRAARAIDVDLRDGELALEVTYPLRLQAMYVRAIDGVPVSFGALIVPEAEGGGLTLGARPELARDGVYRLVWASWGGPIVYGRDGASGGLGVTTELQSVFSADPVRFCVTPKVDLAGAWGEQSAWRVRVSLVLAVGIVDPVVSVWLEGEGGYTVGGEGPGALRLTGSLVVGVRPEALR